MRNYFTLAGRDSRDFGVYISGSGTFNAPAREQTAYPVPGRNGDIIIDGGRFQNGQLIYPAFIYSDFKNNLQAFRNYVLSLNGYQNLVDSYHPDEIRQVYLDGAFEVEAQTRNDAGQFNIAFACKPQRLLASGQTVTTLTATGTIINPTLFAARPLLRVYGTGTVKIGNDTITISTNASYTDIDCDMREAYRGTTNLNANVSLSGLDFPDLKPGTNNIVLTGVTKVDITPRWWRI